MAFTPQDHEYMHRALALAERGLYTATPNPRVGCVIVREGVVVGEGWHEVAGQPHAEINALAGAGEQARGATAYVSLEPCSHHGRTPPCADAFVRSGLTRVVAAMWDPNPRVSGTGLARLAAAGIQVESGLLEAEARELNIGFVSRMTRGLPWVRMKVAASLDGKTALSNGRSQWITGPAARADGHHWRARACALLTGVGTVKEDNPQLNVREVRTPRQPRKLLIDSRLEAPVESRLFEDGNVLVFAAGHYPERAEKLAARGVEVIVLPNPHGKVDLPAMLKELARREFNEVHVEAGFALNGSLLREGCVDELLVYLAPSLIGNGGRGMFDLPQIADLSEQQRLSITGVQRIADDLRVLARVVRQDGS